MNANLNYTVWDVSLDTHDPKHATAACCWDLITKPARTYRAKAVILAAGTLESARIALASNIACPKVGKGIVDHPIYYRHFSSQPKSSKPQRGQTNKVQQVAPAHRASTDQTPYPT